jgi:hypothetical protein
VIIDEGQPAYPILYDDADNLDNLDTQDDDRQFNSHGRTPGRPDLTYVPSIDDDQDGDYDQDDNLPAAASLGGDGASHPSEDTPGPVVRRSARIAGHAYPSTGGGGDQVNLNTSHGTPPACDHSDYASCFVNLPTPAHPSDASSTKTTVLPSKISIPTTFAAAIASPQASDWRQAADSEINAIRSNNTYDLVPAPPGATILPCKWVFTIKNNPDGSIDRYKARLVVGGHRQRDGIDCSTTFAKTADMTSLRIFLAITAAKDYDLHSIDISNAFLNADLTTDIYMKQPEGYVSSDPTYVCKLNKTLYGLKQSPKEWFDLLNSSLSTMGYTSCTADSAIWWRESGGRLTFILAWVDDLLIAAPTPTDIKTAKTEILTRFKGRDLGEPSSYISLHITRDRTARTITINQPTYEKTLIEKYNMTHCNPKTIPLAMGADYTFKDDAEDLLSLIKPYQELVGSLLYLANTTRPDLSTSTNILAGGMSAPTERHWRLAKGVIRYLQGTIGLGITYGRSSTPLAFYTDADYAGCKDTRRSRSGFLCTSYGGAVAWRSKLQKVVTTSSAESEYLALYYAVRETVWITRLCHNLRFPISGPAVIEIDNTAAIKIADNTGDSPKTKHIAVAYHYTRDKVHDGTVRLKQCPTEENAADHFTKPLGEIKLKRFMATMGMT